MLSVTSNTDFSIPPPSWYFLVDTENTIVWVNAEKTIWEGRVIKIPFSEKSEDSKHLKLKWINTKKEERVLIKHFFEMI